MKLKSWAQTVIILSSPQDLEKTAKFVVRPCPCQNAVLLIDSSDFKTTNVCLDPNRKWKQSHKLKHAGRWWVMVCVFHCLTQWISPPHFPKDYDGDLILLHAETLDALFPDTTMLGDNHFKKGELHLKKVTLICNKSEGGRPKVINGKKVKYQLSPHDKKVNDVIAGLQGTVEELYGWIKTKFEALDMSFGEDTDQHDALVWYALAAHRFVVGNK